MTIPLTVILGGDPLAFEVCESLIAARLGVVMLWDEGDVAARAVELGARFVRRQGDQNRALRDAGIGTAAVAMALTDDDRINLEFALAARDLNPAIRIVMRQFNRTLGRKLEENLPNCSVISLESQSAATYAGVAVDPDCFYGLHFPNPDGPLVGFRTCSATAAAVAGALAADAEQKLGARIVASNGDLDYDRARAFAPDDRLTLCAPVQVRVGGAT
ncbi:MAG: NAD-binding protein, partial [Candidatus Eremiobacteraeota bacterium]|nr:NAD-binding protein [Candidatus Eremiobacteraeota bacterium]